MAVMCLTRFEEDLVPLGSAGSLAPSEEARLVPGDRDAA
jgi:hypothetical protein